MNKSPPSSPKQPRACSFAKTNPPAVAAFGVGAWPRGWGRWEGGRVGLVRFQKKRPFFPFRPSPANSPHPPPFAFFCPDAEVRLCRPRRWQQIYQVLVSFPDRDRASIPHLPTPPRASHFTADTRLCHEEFPRSNNLLHVLQTPLAPRQFEVAQRELRFSLRLRVSGVQKAKPLVVGRTLSSMRNFV